MVSEDLRPLASSLLRVIEDLRKLVRTQVGILVANKERQQGSKKTFLTPEITRALVKFDAHWSLFEEEFIMRVKQCREPNEAEILQLLACLMADCIAHLLEAKLISQSMVNDFDPALIVCLPRIMVLRYHRMIEGTRTLV